MRRWEHGVLETIRARIDAGALGGREIADAKLDPLVFDANPASHGALRPLLEARHAALSEAARRADRLPPEVPLITQWKLTYDIYSPKLRCFIEVDERQHFSRARLARIQETRPRYPSYFWESALAARLRSPAVDLDPPHRDEARAYRDEARELLPIAFGLNPTIRLDEFSLSQDGADAATLIESLL